jgi:hypothetical protein
VPSSEREPLTYAQSGCAKLTVTTLT